MDYYKLRITGEKKVWRKYFTYAERFFIDEEETPLRKVYNFADVFEGLLTFVIIFQSTSVGD